MEHDIYLWNDGRPVKVNTSEASDLIRCKAELYIIIDGILKRYEGSERHETNAVHM